LGNVNMKLILKRSIAILYFVFTVSSWVFAKEEIGAVNKPAQPLPPCAVVELFTSEGCSSCPPADEFLSELVQKTDSVSRIYALSFHVDYWDKLGWVDPFSSPYFTDRQRVYASVKKSKNIYTPQMFVNGREGFIGSNRQKAVKNIKAVLEKPSQVAINLTARVAPGKGIIQVDYKTFYGKKEYLLFIALVQHGVVSKVTAGENAGKTLHHENVVVGFKTIRLADGDSGTVEFHFPLEIDLKNFSVIAYAQDPKTMFVLGADRVKFQPASKAGPG